MGGSGCRCRVGLGCRSLVVQAVRAVLECRCRVALVCRSLVVLVGLVYRLAEVGLLERR